MTTTEELRKAFDNCTIMAGVEPDIFECVYIVKSAALLYLDEIDDENAKLRIDCDEWRRVAESKQDIIDHMRDARDDNAKLRELVQYICDENYGDDWFAEKAAELGIEAHY